MKNTYLYVLDDADLWMWYGSRMDASDMTDGPGEAASGHEWKLYVSLSDAIGSVRDTLHKRLESCDRVHIGQHYMIPGSRCEVAREREAEASTVVREVTRLTWDAPFILDHLVDSLAALLRVAPVDEYRDSWTQVEAFLNSNRGRRVIPVWM